MKRRDGDRRSRPRFELMGPVWGVVETVLRLPVRNVGLNGALLESHVPLSPDSVHRIIWETGGRGTTTDVRVCHIKQVHGADGEHTYLVGVAFVSRSPAVTEQIQCWLSEAASRAVVSGA